MSGRCRGRCHRRRNRGNPGEPIGRSVSPDTTGTITATTSRRTQHATRTRRQKHQCHTRRSQRVARWVSSMRHRHVPALSSTVVGGRIRSRRFLMPPPAPLSHAVQLDPEEHPSRALGPGHDAVVCRGVTEASASARMRRGDNAHTCRRYCPSRRTDHQPRGIRLRRPLGPGAAAELWTAQAVECCLLLTVTFWVNPWRTMSRAYWRSGPSSGHGTEVGVPAQDRRLMEPASGPFRIETV